MNVTFCGDKQIADSDKVVNWLENILPALIECGADKFYIGGFGDFDMLSALAVKHQKKVYKNIISILVMAYPDQKYEKNLYENAIYPALEGIPCHLAAIKSSHFMICQSDLVISCVFNNNGDSVQLLNYAREKEKLILQYPFYTTA